MGIEVFINEKGDKGADCFYCRIVTPKKLSEILKEDSIFSGRALFIVDEESMEKNLLLVKKEIEKILQKCERETWEEVALAINYYLDWEYYDPNCGICDFYLTTRGLK